jgi:hypothetical protein
MPLMVQKTIRNTNNLVSVYSTLCRNKAVTQAVTTFSPVLAYQLEPPKSNVTCDFDELMFHFQQTVRRILVFVA